MLLKNMLLRIKHVLLRVIQKLFLLSTTGLSTGSPITRYYMYRHFSQWKEPRSKDLKVLSISGSTNLALELGFENNQIIEVEYPEFTVLNLPFGNEEFDAIVSDQVLEHVEGNPQLAIDELFRVLKPNGISLHTTCLINPVHGAPNDYWRFTPEGLSHLTKKHGTIIDVGGWGNPYVWLFIALGLRSQPIPNTRFHPAHWLATKNNDSWPIHTWIFARKDK
jgi:SAM-dependent methyltransferase